MPVFFAFSDESGKYKKDRTDKFISKNPFYCRSVVLLEAGDWIGLRDKFLSLKKKLLGIDHEQEVKWSYIWSLFKHSQKGERVPKNKPYFYLRHHSLDLLVDFIRKVLQSLSECRSCRIMFTLTFNDREKTRPLEMKKIAKYHIGHVWDLAEKEMRKIPESVCVFFFNREEPALEKCLKEVFFEIYRKSSPKKYSRLKDSLNFEYLPQSFGGQLADYCAGVFNGCCRLYPQSIDLFRNQLWLKILREQNETLGYGITEIPKNSKNRAYLKGILGKIFAAKEEDYRLSLDKKLE
jgi:hypothetical protein